MDRWILSRLSCAICAANSGFTDYNFPLVTSAIYNFWLYELCDIYLEYIKPIVYDDLDEKKAVARNTLYPLEIWSKCYKEAHQVHP